MAGAPAFQSNPLAFQQDAFQSGVQVVAGDYSLGAPSFATPTIKINYQLSVAAYHLGSPQFATPIVGTAFVVISVNPYTLGAVTYAAPTLRSTQRFTVPAYALASPSFAAPALAQVHRVTTNAFELAALGFARRRMIAGYPLTAVPFDLGALGWSTIVTISGTNYSFRVPNNDYSLGSPSFGYPRLQTQFVGIEWPLTYPKATGEAAAMLRKYLDLILSSVPPTPISAERNTVRRLISVLRANADEAIRGVTLGTKLAEIIDAADRAGATFPGVDEARLYLMSQVASKSIYTQIVFRSALIMTLGLESVIVSRMKFKTATQCRNMLVYMDKAFENAKAIGIDEIDVIVYQAMTAMGGALINHLARTELQLPRFVVYETAFPMPSLYLAHRIYQDVRRADEIEQENDVIHPAFMPRRLRVLSDAGIPLEETFLRPRPPAR